MYKSPSGVLSLLLVACATPSAPPQPAAPNVAATPPPIPDTGLRLVPHLKAPMDEDFYPSSAKRSGQTGRVLVEFHIKDDSRATAVTVVAAEAAPVLQQAAVRLVESLTFDLHTKNYDPSDTRPFYMPVEFCLGKCGKLVAYPGYAANDLIV